MGIAGMLILPLGVAVLFSLACPAPSAMAGQNIRQVREMPPLSAEERNVIEDKGTERPYSGKYESYKEAGFYLCRRCGDLLYESGAKFDSGCGWPSFDDEFPGAVKRGPDPDGRRVEITCANCGGHLGHVFTGEGFTAKNTRHCVNSLSMKFIPVVKTETAYFAGGCFWGVEHLFRQKPGVLGAVSGYMGGTTPNPNYEQVCSGATGHAETVRVIFEPDKVSYEELARLFFAIHDPTQLNRQGWDVGTQYRSAVFPVSEAQKQTVEKLLSLLRDKGWEPVTTLENAGTFYPAEGYHQRYIENHPSRACHTPVPRFDKGPE